MPRPLAALDTDVLLTLQADAPELVEAHRLLSVEGFLFIAGPTVLKELDEAASRTNAEFTSALAQNILADPKRLGLIVRSAQDFSDLQGDVTDIHVNRVIDRGVVSEASRGDLTAIMESAYLNCVMFVTTNEEILGKRQALAAALIRECGMDRIYLFSPSEIVEFFPDQ